MILNVWKHMICLVIGCWFVYRSGFGMTKIVMYTITILFMSFLTLSLTSRPFLSNKYAVVSISWSTLFIFVLFSVIKWQICLFQLIQKVQFQFQFFIEKKLQEKISSYTWVNNFTVISYMYIVQKKWFMPRRHTCITGGYGLLYHKKNYYTIWHWQIHIID